MPTREERNGRCTHGRGTRFRPVRACCSRPQPYPREMSCQTPVVEPERLVSIDARGKDLGFPRGSRGLETFDLPDDRVDGARAFHACRRRDMLPSTQKADEVTHSNRLDLRPQPVDGVLMDACEQSALAPLVRSCARREAAAQRKTLRFKRGESGGDLGLVETQKQGKPFP